MNTEFQPDMFRNVFYWQSSRLAHTECKQAITLVDVFEVRKAISLEIHGFILRRMSIDMRGACRRSVNAALEHLSDS